MSKEGDGNPKNRRIGLLLALFRACVKPPPAGTDAVRPGKLLQAMSASSGFEFSKMAPTHLTSGGNNSPARSASDDTGPVSAGRQESGTTSSSAGRAGPSRSGDTGPAAIEFEGRPVASIGISLESEASRSGRPAGLDASEPEPGDDEATATREAASASARPGA